MWAAVEHWISANRRATPALNRSQEHPVRTLAKAAAAAASAAAEPSRLVEGMMPIAEDPARAAIAGPAARSATRSVGTTASAARRPRRAAHPGSAVRLGGRPP